MTDLINVFFCQRHVFPKTAKRHWLNRSPPPSLQKLDEIRHFFQLLWGQAIEKMQDALFHFLLSSHTDPPFFLISITSNPISAASMSLSMYATSECSPKIAHPAIVTAVKPINIQRACFNVQRPPPKRSPP